MTKKHFLDFTNPQETVEELAILAYIFKKGECTALELIDHFKLAEKDLKKKIEIIRKLEIIRYSNQKIKDFNSLTIQSTDQIGFFFKKFYYHVISKEAILYIGIPISSATLTVSG